MSGASCFSSRPGRESALRRVAASSDAQLDGELRAADQVLIGAVEGDWGSLRSLHALTPSPCTPCLGPWLIASLVSLCPPLLLSPLNPHLSAKPPQHLTGSSLYSIDVNWQHILRPASARFPRSRAHRTSPSRSHQTHWTGLQAPSIARQG